MRINVGNENELKKGGGDLDPPVEGKYTVAWVLSLGHIRRLGFHLQFTAFLNDGFPNL